MCGFPVIRKRLESVDGDWGNGGLLWRRNITLFGGKKVTDSDSGECPCFEITVVLIGHDVDAFGSDFAIQQVETRWTGV